MLIINSFYEIILFRKTKISLDFSLSPPISLVQILICVVKSTENNKLKVCNVFGVFGGGLLFMKSSSLCHRPRPKAETKIQNAV